MINFPFPRHAHSHAPQNDTDTIQHSPEPLPRQTDSGGQDDAERRLAIMEDNEPKRRLIRDARALAKIRKITQGQTAEAPGETLIRRWLVQHGGELS